MAVSKILRNDKDYEMPIFSASKRNSVPNNQFSNYYLNNLTVPKGQLGINLLREQTISRTIALAEQKKNASPKPSTDSLYSPLSVQNEENNFLTPDPLSKLSTKKTPVVVSLRKQNKKTRRMHNSQDYTIEDFGKVSDLGSIFQRVAPEKYSNQNNSRRLTHSVLVTPRSQIKIPKNEGKVMSTKITINREMSNESVKNMINKKRFKPTPVAILDKFSEMVGINMQQVAKILLGNKKEKQNALNLKEKDMHIDLCEYNNRILPDENTMKMAFSPTYSRNFLQPNLSLPPLLSLSPRKNEIISPIKNIEDLQENSEFLRENNIPIILKAKSEKSCKNTSNQHKLNLKSEKIKRHLNKPTDVLELDKFVKEKIDNHKKIKDFCQKCKFDLLAKSSNENTGELNENSKKFRIKSKELYDKAVWQIMNDKFNIKRRFIADTVGIDKYRKELVQMNKMLEKYGLEQKDNAKVKNAQLDEFISKNIYQKHKNNIS